MSELSTDEKTKYRNFVAKVKEMREAQHKYFQTRQPSILQKAKELEKEVDEMIKSFVPTQASIF